jgi:hypothetical protein
MVGRRPVLSRDLKDTKFEPCAATHDDSHVLQRRGVGCRQAIKVIDFRFVLA